MPVPAAARWGKAPEIVGGFIAYEGGYLVKYQGASYQNNWICFPIPNDEIVNMQGVLVQNAVWK